MAPTLAITHLTTTSRQARQRVIDSLTTVANFAQDQEPDVLRYAITTPRIEGDDVSIYVIEEYATPAALNSHLGSQAHASYLSHFGQSTLLASPPSTLTYTTFTSYSRPTALTHPDPYILIAAWDYQPDTRGPALEGWREYNAGCQRDEDGTMVQVLAKDENDPTKVGGVMAFDSERYFWDVHVAGEHTQRNKGKFGEIRTRTDLAYFQLVGGFLHKAQRGSRL